MIRRKGFSYMLIAMIILAPMVALTASATDQSNMTALQIHEFGGREVLKLEQVPRPTPGDNEMLVRVYAAAVNPVDWKIRQSGGRMGKKLPWIPGFDVSGVVEQTGSQVTKFKSGD